MPRQEETSIAAVFQNQAERFGAKALVAYKKEGQYIDISWNDMNGLVKSLASFMISRGIGKGDRVAIFSPNRYEWWVADLALLSIGAIDVPIYSTNSADEACYVLEHSGARACFLGEDEHLQRFLEIREKLPALEFAVTFDSTQKVDPSVLKFSDAISKGKDNIMEEEFETRLKSLERSDPATIIYTSGTTGPPKGVVLTHGNFLSNVDQIMEDFRELLTPEDVFLSFLPLSHSLERTAGYYLPLRFGGKVAFAESFLTIQENLQEIRPTLIVSVPRLYEKIHTGIISKVKTAPALKKALFNWALNIAKSNLHYVCTGEKREGLFALKVRIAEKLIFSKLKAALGMDMMKFAVSGGGPLSITDGEFFLGMGIIILEGFGLTETTPVTHVNRPWLIKPGTVGPPMPDTEVRLSDYGEILIKGPQVMKGYYMDEEATKEVFTDDGYFKTGDMGAIDEMGYLSITGRLKEIIITSGGKNVSPQNIENTLKDSLYVEQVSVIGDRRKYLSALIIPAFEELKKWARQNGVSFESNDELIRKQEVMDFYEKEIEKYNTAFSRMEQIKKFTLLPREWSQDTGELTPTLKLKRRVIEKKYSQEIDDMYPPEE